MKKISGENDKPSYNYHQKGLISIKYIPDILLALNRADFDFRYYVHTVGWM